MCVSWPGLWQSLVVCTLLFCNYFAYSDFVSAQVPLVWKQEYLNIETVFVFERIQLLLHIRDLLLQPDEIPVFVEREVLIEHR